jgi:predicted nucleic acid-binding protein
MRGFLLDTNVISEFAHPDNEPEARVRQWLESVDPESLYASVLTCGEIRKGIEKLDAGKRRTHLEQWLEKDFHEWFENRLLVVNEAIANRWGILTAEARRKGRPLAIIDGLLSATALEHDLTVVTRNSSDFSNIGASVLNPWEAK